MKLGYLALVIFYLSFVFQVASASEVFISDLRLNSQNKEVLLLQKLLNTDPDTQVATEGAGSVGYETLFFGPLTHAAVISFQEKYKDEILAPFGLLNGTGIVDAKTRMVLNRISGNIPVIQNPQLGTDNLDQTPKATKGTYPQITRLSTGIIRDPSLVPLVITGDNFLAKNQVFLSTQGFEIFDAPSIDGKTISVFLVSKLTKPLEAYINTVIKQSGGTQTRKSIIDALKVKFDSVGRDGLYMPAVVFVRNENGESNKFGIKVNILKD